MCPCMSVCTCVLGRQQTLFSEGSLAVGQLGYTWPEPGLSWSVVLGALSWSIKLGTGDLPIFCDKITCQGKMRTEQSLALKQFFPFKSEYAGNKSSLHCLREQPWPQAGVLTGSMQGTEPWTRDFGWPRSLLLFQRNGRASGIPPLLPRG